MTLEIKVGKEVGEGWTDCRIYEEDKYGKEKDSLVRILDRIIARILDVG